MPDHAVLERIDCQIELSREAEPHEWTFDPTVYANPPAEIRPQLWTFDETYNEIHCSNQRYHVQDHRRWYSGSAVGVHERSNYIYRTCARCEDGTYPGRCHDGGCRACWPRPDLPPSAFHMMYRSREQIREQVSPWAHRGNQCGDARYCRVCYPLWAMNLVELSAFNARERRESWERHVAIQRMQLLEEMHEKATKRAQELLKSLCTPEQWENYRQRQQIPVTGSKGGQYLIEKGYSGNVIVVGEERRWGNVARKCAHPRMSHGVVLGNLGTGHVSMAEEDAMITQMLCIQANEEHWLDVANNF